MPSTGQYPLSLFTNIRHALQVLESADIDPNKFLEAIVTNPRCRDAVVKAYLHTHPVIVSGIPDSPGDLVLFAAAVTGYRKFDEKTLRKHYSWLSNPSEMEEIITEAATQGKLLMEAVEHLSTHENFVGLFEGLDKQSVSVIVTRFGLADGTPLTVAKVAELHQISARRVYYLEHKALNVIARSWRNRHGTTADATPANILDLQIENLGLSDRPRHCLHRNLVNTVRDLLTKTEEDLLSMTHFGLRSLDEVNAKLAEHGLSLKQ